MKSVWILVMALVLIGATAIPNGFAQFNGREILDNICKGMSRGRRDDQGDDAQRKKNRVARPAPDTYEQMERDLALLEADLQLQSQQKQSWQAFAGKVRDYAGELSRERAQAAVPRSEGAAVDGLQHIQHLTDAARTRLSDLQEIRAAADELYATLSPDQKKIADTRIVTMIAPFTPAWAEEPVRRQSRSSTRTQ
jgi:hypothetical protein